MDFIFKYSAYGILLMGILFSIVGPTTKYLLKRLTTLVGSVTVSQLDIMIEMSELFGAFMVTKDQMPFKLLK